MILTLKPISKKTKLKYAICLTCVNREEKGHKNIIEETFKSFENGGMFSSRIDVEYYLFESGSKSLEYLNFIENYKIKYPELKINIIESSFPLDGFTNTHRMCIYLNNLNNTEIKACSQSDSQCNFVAENDKKYDFVLWMDDDIWVCKKFLENMDAWVKRFGNFSVFSSLYVPFITFPMKNNNLAHTAYIYNYFGSCCTIFKPELVKYIPVHFFNKVGKPDSKFRRCIEHYFPNNNKILVSSVSLVQHMNAGSVNHANTKGYGGHKAKNYVGNIDPKIYKYI